MRHTVLDQSSTSADDHASDDPDTEQVPGDIEAEFGGREARLHLERKLLRKLDMRMSILVLIYILNYVRLPISSRVCVLISAHRSIGIMLRESCGGLSPVTADKIRQGRSSGRVRGRLESERARIQYTPRRPLFRLHFNADTFVSIRNSPAVSCSMTFQKYVFELYWKALHISPHLHGTLGCSIYFNRSGADALLTLLVSRLCRHYSQLYGCPYHPIPSWLRRGLLFPWCSLSPVKVVHALRAWSSYCDILVRCPY